MNTSLDLLDYRRRVAEIYRSVRQAEASEETWLTWRRSRDELFTGHPQTPLENSQDFTGLSYFRFDPAWRVEGRFVAGEDKQTDIAHSGDGATGFTRVGVVDFDLDGRTHQLEVLWLNSYGGGLFIPFRDSTNGAETYGGGRYLIDTAKGADLGQTETGIVLDFNYAYHPSCVHSYRWSCPLAPPSNNLDVAITAGERLH
ncbi:MAG TPA: DUF1684 domain-containing protein [Acidimicrobiia bacterium]